MPTAPNTQGSARTVITEPRVAYVDNDEVVLAHLRALAAHGNPGVTVVEGDVRDVAVTLKAVSAGIDLSRPACLLMGALLHFFPVGAARDLVALLNRASLPTSLGLLSSAWPRMDFRLGLKAAVLLSRRRNSNCYRTSHRPATPRMSFPTSLESRIPRLAPRGPISDFCRTFHLPAGQEMFFPIRQHRRATCCSRTGHGQKIRLPIGRISLRESDARSWQTLLGKFRPGRPTELNWANLASN
jgi:O-methyltransferase involved in polyketide biosynthesis